MRQASAATATAPSPKTSSPTTLTTSGSLSVSDVDSGENQFTTTVTPAAGAVGTLGITTAGAWTYTVANSAVQSLGAGATKQETFTVQSQDGTASQDITVTLSGVNDAASISGDTSGTVTEDSSAPN